MGEVQGILGGESDTRIKNAVETIIASVKVEKRRKISIDIMLSF